MSGEKAPYKHEYDMQYDKRAYKSYHIRIRNDTELAKCVEAHLDSGRTSLNFLVTRLLCDYFDVPLPHKRYEVQTILTGSDAEEHQQ